jgi:hypothetical protein
MLRSARETLSSHRPDVIVPAGGRSSNRPDYARRAALSTPSLPGFDPAIHPLRKTFSPKTMAPRITCGAHRPTNAPPTSPQRELPRKSFVAIPHYKAYTFHITDSGHAGAGDRETNRAPACFKSGSPPCHHSSLPVPKPGSRPTPAS